MWVMKLQISRTQRQQLLDWAALAEPNECCGLLFGFEGAVGSLELTINVANVPVRAFEIDPAALIAAEKRARNGEQDILGYFHSHPNGSAFPSLEDAHMAAPDGRTWLIIAGGDITAWLPVSSPDSDAVRFVPEVLLEG
jgi:desampylase